PSRSRPRAVPLRPLLWRAARRCSVRASRERKYPRRGRALRARTSSSLCRATGRTQSTRLDDLPLDGKAPSLAEPAQALHDTLVVQLLGGAAIVADHELAFVGMLDVDAGDKRARRLDFMDQFVREQEFERAVDCRRPEFAASALQFGEKRVGTHRLIR